MTILYSVQFFMNKCSALLVPGIIVVCADQLLSHVLYSWLVNPVRTVMAARYAVTAKAVVTNHISSTEKTAPKMGIAYNCMDFWKIHALTKREF